MRISAILPLTVCTFVSDRPVRRGYPQDYDLVRIDIDIDAVRLELVNILCKALGKGLAVDLIFVYCLTLMSA